LDYDEIILVHSQRSFAPFFQVLLPMFARPLTNDLGITQQDDATMEWFMDAKFGMFLHWGIRRIRW